jgi:phosphatidate cytidylyltransferase
VLAQRLAVAAVGLPLLALLLLTPEAAFAPIVTLLLAFAAFEFVRAAAPESELAVPAGAGAAAALLIALARGVDDFPLWLMLLPLAAALAGVLWRGDTLARPTPAWWLAGVLYVGVLGAHFVLLRNLDDGQRWLVVMLAVTFATDTGAYTVGRLLGRHRMAPAISPAKTWEGAGGGLAAGAGAGVLATTLLDLGTDAPGPLLIPLALPAAAIAGDLLESALKRRMGVKDISTLLPGHGGLLDRLDSLLLVGPSLYWMLRWLQT